MSLAQLKKADLLKLVEKFEIDVDEDAVKADIVTALEKQGITMDTYKKFVEEEEVKNKPVENESPTFRQGGPVLLKMDRQNRSIEVLGYRFSQEHPYQVVDEGTAQQIIDVYPGFRIASPQEAKDFYG